MIDDPTALPRARQRLREVRAKLRDYERRLRDGESVGEERAYYALIVQMWQRYIRSLERKQ